ncbi:MAG: non-ribosomal peptide synthetase component F, partial [Cellvibrionaceae bacterium]
MTYSESAVSELSTTRFLTQLRQLGVRVWLDGEKLRYQAAKGVMTAELLAELSSRKAEVVTLIQQAKQSNLPDTAAQLTISPASRSQPIPLSVAQQRLWFLEQLHGASSAYNIVGAFVFEGHLDVQALQDSLTEIVRRHESLRTTFALAGDQAAQIVQPAEVVPLPCHDLSHLPKEARWAEARRLATAEASLPFDIADDLLLRGQLVKTTADQHIFLLTFHHLVTDGVSVGIFNHELATLYSAFVAGTSAELPHLPVQYADYAASQHKWMTAGAFTDLVGYWQKQLAGAPELLQLPFDHPRPAVQTFNGAVCASTITNDVVAQLRELARAEGTTLYMVVQAAFSAFLGRYCNQQDVLTGLSVANRPNEQLADLIGFFVNTLVVRVDLSARPTFRQLLRQTRATVLDAFEHQALPFEKLVEAVRPERDMSYAPLVQAMMSWLDGDATLPQLPGLTITPFESDFVPARLDLLLEVYEAGDWLKLMWLYNTDLFDIKTVERLGLNFELFLQAIVSDPDRSVHTLPLMSDAEQKQVTVGFNDSARPYNQNLCLHELFEAQVERTPEKTAVVFGDQTLSYAALNQRANQVAHRLSHLGVAPGMFVGVAMERSLEMVIALYGVLKAGVAYVPLDPSYPADRLAFMLDDAAVPVLLTQPHLAGQFTDVDAQVICVDESLYTESSENFDSQATAQDLAYMIYTSGSTGKPKGALNSHAGIVNRLLWMQERYLLKDDDRILQKTPFSFDVSVWEFFWPLLNGATLVVVRPEGHKDGRYLTQLIQAENITTIHF